MRLSCLFIFFAFKLLGQEFVLTHIAIGSNVYYELQEGRETFLINMVAVSGDSLIEKKLKVKSVEMFRKTYDVENILKIRRLESNWYIHKDVQYTVESATPYKIWKRKSGAIELYNAISYNELGIANWSKIKSTPKVLVRKLRESTVVLFFKNNNLGVLYRHKSKGLLGAFPKEPFN